MSKDLNKKLASAALAGLMSIGMLASAAHATSTTLPTPEKSADGNSCKGANSCKEGGKCKEGATCKEGGKCKEGASCKEGSKCKEGASCKEKAE